jgi:hypothetical protein
MDKTIFVFDVSTGIGPGNFDKYGHIYTSIKEVYENDLSTKYCGERYRINSQCDQNSDFWYACYLRSETDAKSSEWLQLEATYKRIKKYHSYNVGESDLMGAIFAAEKTFKPKIFRINGKDTTRDNFVLWVKEQSIKILGALRNDTK